MRKRRLSIVWVVALCLGLSLAGLAAADTSTGNKKEPTKQAGGKAKSGAPCKADTDCDQSGRPLRCSSDNKCELAPVHPVT